MFLLEVKKSEKQEKSCPIWHLFAKSEFPKITWSQWEIFKHTEKILNICTRLLELLERSCWCPETREDLDFWCPWVDLDKGQRWMYGCRNSRWLHVWTKVWRPTRSPWTLNLTRRLSHLGLDWWVLALAPLKPFFSLTLSVTHTHTHTQRLFWLVCSMVSCSLLKQTMNKIWAERALMRHLCTNTRTLAYYSFSLSQKRTVGKWCILKLIICMLILCTIILIIIY